MLFGLVAVLFAALYQIVAAVSRDARRPAAEATPDEDPRRDARARRQALIALVVFAGFLTLIAAGWDAFNARRQGQSVERGRQHLSQRV